MSTATAPANLSPAPTATTVNGGAKVERKGNVLVKWITTTDHKTIGYLYLITSFIYFCIGGVMALVIRAQLFTPGLDVRAARTSSTTSCSRCTARSCCCCSRRRCSPASPTSPCRCRSARRTWRSRV